MEDKVFIIDGHRIVLNNPAAYERTLKELKFPERYCTRILNEDQIVLENKKHARPSCGVYYFAIHTCDGKRPPVHKH